MVRAVLAIVTVLAGPALAQTTLAQTPGPTADPATTNQRPPGLPDGGDTTTRTTPLTPSPGSPVPATPPSGAPPDVIIVPK